MGIYSFAHPKDQGVKLTMPTISVIVPIYNVESYLRQCVDSILEQTFCDYELILVDDGSPDGCPAICDEYARRDSRVRVLHKENGGVAAARNAGLDAALGEYIFFLDSDDWLHRATLERMLDICEKTNGDMVICNLECAYPSDYVGWRRDPGTIPSKVYTNKEIPSLLTATPDWPYVVAWNKLYRHHIWDDLRYPAGCIHEDEAVIHRILERCKTVAVVEDRLYFYRQNVASSIMGQGIRIQSLDKLPALADRILCARDNHWEAVLETAIGAFVWMILEYYPQFSRNQENEKYFRRADESLIQVFPLIMHSRQVSMQRKIHLWVLRYCPGLYKALRRSKWKTPAKG